MKPFYRVDIDPAYLDPINFMAKFKCDLATALGYVEQMKNEEYFENGTYQVHRSQVFDNGSWPPFIHLSIKRLDREVIHDWRDIQEIKNMLVGPENEGIEIYPAESRLVDCANQYHCWVFVDPTVRILVGWKTRMVMTPEEAAFAGGKQREREPHELG